MRIYFFAGLLLLGSACYKGKLPYTDARFGNIEFKQCVIARIDGPDTGESAHPNSAHLVFTYNSLQNPVMAEPNVVATGSPRWIFYYGPWANLVTFAGVYDNGQFEFWHNYSYDQYGRIVGDSTYIFGQIGNLPTSYERRFSKISYDGYSRVAGDVTTSSITPGQQTNLYNYDSKGNLIREGITYDDKANLYLTNKFWRFLARDYSINNPVKYTVYSEHGLPVYRVGGFENSSSFFWNVYGAPVSIQYDCSPGGPAKRW